MATSEEEKQIQPRIKHVPYDKELVIYSIDHSELDTLAKGVDLPIYLNLSIFLFSLSGSLVGSMIPTISNDSEKPCSRLVWGTLYTGAGIFLVGIILLITWIVKGKKVRHIVNEIKARRTKADGQQLS